MHNYFRHKIGWKLLVGLCLGCILFGYGNSPSEKIRLEFWTISLSPTYEDYIRSLEAEFEQLHPEVDVVWNDIPHQAVLQKLMASIAGGVSPDLVNLNTEFALRLAASEALVPLDGLVSEDAKGRYFPKLWEAVTHEGQGCAFPWYVTTRVLMLNREVLNRAGFEQTWVPRTWDDVELVAQRVAQADAGVGYFPSIKMTQDWGMQGLPVLDRKTMTPLFDSPIYAQRLEWYRNMFQQGFIPKEALTEGYRGALDRFMSGRLAILEAGPQFLLRIQQNAPQVYADTEVVVLPRLGEAPFPVATMNFVVPRASKHRELAVELGLFLTSPENQRRFCALVPILPSTPATLESSIFQELDLRDIRQKAVAVSASQLENAQDYTLNIPLRTPLMRVLGESVTRACSGQVTTEQALSDCAHAWHELLGGVR